MSDEKRFGTVDLVVFIGMVFGVASIGAFYAFKDRKNTSLDNYYFGGKNMSPIPVGLSMAVSFISSITILGYPVQSYIYGTVIVWFGLSTAVQVVIACIYYIPLFHRLKIVSVYEYLEMRFHKSIRRLASFVVAFAMIFYMGTTIYVTALALSAVTPVSTTASILVTAGICTLYTALGGMKAVIWTDTLQSGIMMAGSVAVLIKTTMEVGGVNKVSMAVKQGGRDTMWDFNPDPTLQHTFWTIFVGMGLTWSGGACTNQLITQRYRACKGVKDTRIAAMVSAVPMVSFMVIAALNGCAMYAYYKGCDPYNEGKVAVLDQMVPYLVVDIFSDTPGMAGVFVSAAYSGVLSTISSGINSMSAIVLEDFIIPWKPGTSEAMRLTTSKVLGIICGAFVTSVAFLTQYLGKTVVKIAVTIIGVKAGPLLGIFTVGIFFPWTNTVGAMSGLVSGIAFSTWVALGQITYAADPEKVRRLPLSVENCLLNPATNSTALDFTNVVYTLSDNRSIFTTSTGFTESISSQGRPFLADTLYAISYTYLGALGFSMTFTVSLIISIITGKKDPKSLNPSLFVPFVDNKCFPMSVRKFFRFGVPELKETKIDHLPAASEKLLTSSI
ncbi:sodium-coupled monocarboxylate transporter 1-like [Clavelina lepadiformis]|uniref:sodium-coupled monocarboxylate transporter 1-like n=1 Tax=Clavelina lepadiformis TaxID=159417 RepID=UPI00404141BF